jgi:hypothetical protein
MGKPAPICVNCAQEMRCAKNDFAVKDKESGPFPATVWLGDKYQCPSCKTEIAVSFGKGRPGPDVSDLTLDTAQEFSR